MQELYVRGCKQVIPYELSVLMVEQSPRILHAIEPNPDLLDYMLAYFSKLVQTQEKMTKESLDQELGISKNVQESGKKLTFLESITSGELDFFELEKDEHIQEEKDTNAELRMEVCKCYPALVLLLCQHDTSSSSESDYSD